MARFTAVINQLGIFVLDTLSDVLVTPIFLIPTSLNIQVMKDLRHDNLNSFIGACVEPEQIRIVSEYCTRGSLR